MVSPSPKIVPADLATAYPWSGTWLDVDGGRMHYLDEGPRDAPVMLALHGNPTWSFYWRELIKNFSDRYRVVVPDHIGCGLSDKPQGWPYRLAGHIGNVERLVDHLGLKDITFVLHDWGGAIGMGVAGRRPELARQFIVTNTAAFRSERIPLSIASCKWPVYGPIAVRGFNGFARVATLRASAKGLSPAAKKGLLFPYRSWASRIATLRFVEDIPMDASHPSWSTLGAVEDDLAKFADRPMLLIWGEKDFCFNASFREEWQRRFPDAEAVSMNDVSHYVMEDAPKRSLDAMEQFLARTSGSVS